MNLIGKRFELSTKPKSQGIIVTEPMVVDNSIKVVVLFDTGQLDMMNVSNIKLYHYNPEPNFD